MMRARLGIDKTKSWADWAEEEEEAAELTKTLEAATAEQFKPRLLLGVRLRGGAVESESGHESGEESGGEGEKGGGEGGGEDGGEGGGEGGDEGGEGEARGIGAPHTCG